ncbi:MAG: hypothetical protein KKA54_13015 [Proteobacteria bacterium]|nr:hypothetical protein [Pseudomonadota bacterium]MBU0967288.1 hypothetical protein [Pseudomonadota bacterium]
MKNFRYTLFVCLCVSLLSISVVAWASTSGCESKKAASEKTTDETVVGKVVEEPAMAAIPPAEKGKETTNGQQLVIPPLKEEPAMAAIPGK